MQRQKLIALGLLHKINNDDGAENDESVERQMELMQRQEREERKALLYQLVRRETVQLILTLLTYVFGLELFWKTQIFVNEVMLGFASSI